MRNKQILEQLPLTPFFLQGSTSSRIVCLLPSSSTRGRGMGTVVSHRTFVSATPSCSGEGTPHILPLFHRWVPPTSDSPPWTSPTCILPSVIHELLLPANLLQRGSSLHWLPTNAARTLLQHGLPTESQPPLAFTCSSVEFSTGVLPYGPPWAAGAQLPPHGLHHGISVPSCPFSTDLGVCRAVPFTQSHSSLWLQWSSFSPLLKSITPLAP